MTDAEDLATEQPTPAVITLPGEIDMANGEETTAQLRAAIAAAPRTLIADLTGTTFIDSSGARALYQLHREAAAHGTQVRFAVPHAAVLRVLELMGLDQVLPLYPTLDQAGTPPSAPPATR